MKWLTWIVLAVMLTPLALSIAVSFTPSRYLELPREEWTLTWYRQFFDDPGWLRALRNSLVIAGLTAAVSVITAIATASASAETSFQVGRRLGKSSAFADGDPRRGTRRRYARLGADDASLGQSS